jgi:hypothetical protein
MPQISLYVDKETLSRIERAAQNENISISRWVGEHIRKAMQDDYPADYFNLFGSIRDETFAVPTLDFSDDTHREAL